MRKLYNQLRPRPSSIGLDIGHDGIKMIQLAAVGTTLSATACGRWSFPDNVGDEPALRRRFAVDAVRGLLRSGGFRGRRVVSCLGADELMIKQLRLPRMSEHELRSAVQWEAAERFGLRLAPDQLNHLVAGEIRQGGEVRDEIILLGVRPEVIDEHVAMLDEMKLLPDAIDAEPVCLFRCFDRFLRRRDDQSEVTVLVDLGARGTRVVIGRGRQVAFIKTIDIGGRQLNAAVAEQLNMPHDEAAQLRLGLMRDLGRGGELAEGNEQTTRAIYDAIRPVVDELGREISLCLRYYAVTFRGAKPEGLTLVGGEAYDPTLRKLLDETLSLECVLGEPLWKIDLSGVDLGDDRRGVHCEWAVAVGLALRGMDALGTRETTHEHDRLSA